MDLKKNPNVNNEKVKFSLGVLGLFIILSLVLASFTYGEMGYLLGGGEKDQREGEKLVQAELKEPETPDQPEPDEPDITPPPTEDTKVDKEIKVDTVVKTAPPVNLPPPAPVKTGPPAPPPIVDFPDVEASFQGGVAAMKQFIGENVSYPEIAREMGDQGKVYVEFRVDPDGSISSVKVLRGVSKELDREAKRVVKMMPKWKPGEVRGEPVPTKCRIPITFSLK